jgi:hypothetical protein
MKTIYAVYQYGWQDGGGHETPIGNGVTVPCRALIGLCRGRAKAERIAVRIRRLMSEAPGPAVPGAGKPLPLIDVSPYNPFSFLPDEERWRDEPTRAEAHRRVVAGVSDRRTRLGIA